MRTILLVVLLLMNALSAAVASTIFKCKDAKGVVIFQQVACAAGQGIGAQSFQRVPDSPNWTPSDNRDKELLERLEAIVAEQRPASPPRVGSRDGQDDVKPSGFVCDDGRTQWVQPNPCPASTEHYKTRAVNGVTNTGVPIHGTTRQTIINPVEQKALSRAEMCDALKNNPATTSKGDDDVYERNKLRDANGCY